MRLIDVMDSPLGWIFVKSSEIRCSSGYGICSWGYGWRGWIFGYESGDMFVCLS